jgi:transposase
MVIWLNTDGLLPPHNHHTESHDYLVKRRAEGKSDREIRRYLKRHLARRFFKLLQRVDNT